MSWRVFLSFLFAWVAVALRGTVCAESFMAEKGWGWGLIGDCGEGILSQKDLGCLKSGFFI